MGRQEQAGQGSDLEALRRRFASVPELRFDAVHGLVRVQVATKLCTATIYQQGAHLAAWQPAGQQPVIFLSSKSDFAPGKPIRGGVPVVFPWFSGDHRKGIQPEQRGPSHGFARIQPWALDAVSIEGGEAKLTFTLGPTQMSRTMGYDHFHVALAFRLGREMEMTMTVANEGAAPLWFEQGFHTYFQVEDVHEATVEGLEDVGYTDKTEGFAEHPAARQPIVFAATVDRTYDNTVGPYLIRDVAGRRTITVHKTNSKTTVVWNPWKQLPDLGEWEWHSMLALETLNAGVNAITLAPGASWVMGSRAVVEKA